MTWSLADIEERAAQNPQTFRIPSRRMRESLSPGNLAKLVFEIDDELRPAPPQSLASWHAHKLVNVPETSGRESRVQSEVDDTKLCRGERMWVRVLERRDHPGGGKHRGVDYVGELINDPLVLAGEIREGERIAFRPEHVASWEPGE